MRYAITNKVIMQRVDDLIVLLDEEAGTEITVPATLAHRAIAAIAYASGIRVTIHRPEPTFDEIHYQSLRDR